MKKLYPNLFPVLYCSQRQSFQPGGSLVRNHVSKILLLFFLQAIFLSDLGWSQNSLNSGDFSTGSWGVGQAMSASAGSSLIITKGVSSSGDKYFRFYGDGSPCGEYQPNADGDYFTHNVVVTTPNANCGSANAWRINVPSATSNVVFKTDGGNDGMDRSIAFVVQGPVESVSSVSRSPAGTVYPGQDVVITANLTADFSTGQDAWLRYTNNGFTTSTVIKMTGSGTSRTATIPGTANLPSTAVAYYVFTSSDGASIAPADADFYTINLNNNGGSNYTYTPAAGWQCIAGGNWSDGTIWNAGVTPPTNASMGAVTFAAGTFAVTLNQDAVVGSINLATGKTLNGSDGSARKLSIAAGGAFTRVGTFTATATGTVEYLGNGSISAATTWQNLFIGGTLTVTGVQTINGTIRATTTAAAISAAPTYTATSTLSYSANGAMAPGNFWTSTATVGAVAAGRPNDVVIEGNTTLNMPAANRGLARDISIASGSTLNLNATSGDLYVQRNWTNAGTFNHNNRAVGFTGTSLTTNINNVSGESFAYLIVTKTTAGNVILNCNVSITGNGGSVLQMTNATTNVGSIDLNGNDLTISGTSGDISIGAGALVRNIIGTGNLIISGGPKVVTRSATSTLVLAAGVNVQLSNSINFGGFTTLNGTLTINAGGSVTTNAPIYGANSTLVYNSGGSYGISDEWTSTAQSGAAAIGRPNDVVIQNNTTLNMTTTDRGLARDLTIGSGSTLNLNGTSGDLYLQRNWSNAGTFNPNGRAVGFYGTSISSTITNSSGETFNYLLINKITGGTVTFNNNVTVNGSTGDIVQFLGTTTGAVGSIDLNGNTLTLSGTGGNIYLGNTAAMARQINATGSGNVVISGGTKTVTKGGLATTTSLAFATTVTVILTNGLDCGAGSFTTINGTLQINSGGFVINNTPIYGTSSQLTYNSGTSYNIGTEWTASLDGVAATGRPNNVTIQNSTTLNGPAGVRAMAGNLTIESGSSLVLDNTAGDFILRGNWVNNGGTFTHNNRTVSILGGANSTVGKPSGGPETFYELIIAKSATGFTVTATSDIDIVGNGTFGLQLTTAGVASTLDLGGFSLDISGTGGINVGTATAATNRTITNGTVILSSNAKTISRNALANGILIISGTATLETNVATTVGVATVLTVNGILQINSGGSLASNPVVYGASSTLRINTGGSFSPGTDWTATADGVAGSGLPNNVTIQNSTTVNMPGTARAMAGTLTIQPLSGLTLNNTLFIRGNWDNNGTFNPNSRLVQFTGTTSRSILNANGVETFDGLTLAKTAGLYLFMNCNLVINGVLTITTGRLNINGNSLTINNNASTAGPTNGTISGDVNSSLFVNGSGASCVLAFTTAVAENQLDSLVINRIGPGTININSNLLIDNGSGLNNSILTLTSGWVQINTGFTLTLANTSVTGSANSFVFTQTTGRLAYSVTGAGTYNFSFPIGSAANVNSYRRLALNNVIQTNDNVYTVASTTGTAASQNPTFNAPLLGGSTVRYYPVDLGNLGVLTSIASVSLSVGVDDNPIGIDNQTIIQVFGGAWNDIGATGGAFKTSVSTPDISSAANLFAFGFTTLGTVFVNNTTGNDAFSGQTSNNVPAGTGPKQTFAAAMAAITNGGTISYIGGGTPLFAAQTWDIDKNINITQTGALANTTLTNVTINVAQKAVMPFTAAEVNTATDRITITAHTLATGMALTYNNYGASFGLMPSGINVGSDQLTVGTNIPTGQPVIYQAYAPAPAYDAAASAAGGLTHGNTYYAINVNPTTIRLAATYADAIGGTPVDITSVGSAESHGIIVSTIEGLTSGTNYFVIVIDANTIQLAATNPDALEGNAIDLVTAGAGNHVLIFTPVLSGIVSFKTPINITSLQANISPFSTLLPAANGNFVLSPGTFFMQPCITINKPFNIIGDGIGSTILDGGGKISSASTYYGIAYPTTALAACTLTNFTVTGYYIGINRNSTAANTSNVIEAVESSNNFNRGLNWEGTGAITTALTIRNSIFNNNNGVGAHSAGIYINGMAKAGLNIRNNTCNGNRNVGIEIGPVGTNANFSIKNNSIAGVNSVSPLQNSTTEFGIVVSDVTPTGANTHISENTISMYGRAGIECRGCVGNGLLSGNGSFRIASNYITQAGGPFRVEPNTTLQNEVRDVAGIAVGSMNGSAVSSGMAIDSNHVEGLQQPFSASTAYTAFGIVTAGANQVVRTNIVSGCEIGIQPQQGSSGNENNTPDDFYSRDNTPTSTNFLANRNSIISNTVFAARNQGLTGTINFMGNWWGDQNGPTHASNTNSGFTGFGAGAGQPVPAGTGIAYNAHLGEDPDEDAGTPLLQITKGLKFRLKPTANSVQLSGAGTLYVINQGLSVCQSLTPTTGLTDTLDLAPITWTLPGQSLLIRRRMHLRGNFGSGTKPIISGTGSSVHPQEQSPNARMLINMAAQNSGIENLDIRFSVPAFVFGVSNLMGIADTVLTVASVINGMVIKNNIIQNTGSYNFTSYGLYIKSLNYSSDPSIVTVTGNQIGSPGASFGAPIRIWSCRGNFTNNTLTGLYAFRWGTPIVGTGTWEIANNTFNGSMELNSQQANSTLNVHDNIFNRNSAVGHPQGIEVRLNRLPTAFCNIYNNTFNNIGQGGYPYWGILSLRCQNVSITDNIFNAHSAATDFQFIHASTRQQGTLANPTDNFLNTISIKGNQFNGNASAGTNKVGINFARHRSEQTFGTIEIGGPNPADTNTFTGLSRFVECDPYTGNFSGLGLPYSGLTGTPDATCVPMDVDFDISQNKFQVSGGTKAPHIMSKTELLELEDKIQHAVDYGSLGFVTVKPLNAYVTPASFLSGYTATPLIARALNKASDGWTITTKTATYNETVTIDKDLTFANNGNTVLQNLTMNGSGKTLTLADDFDVSNGGTLTLTDGIIETGSNILTILNPAAGAATGYSSTSHVKGNLKRAINTGTLYVYPVGNGTDIQELSMTFNTVSSLTDVTVSFTNTAPGTNVTSANEAGAQYNDILQTGYWIVEPNVGGNATNYSMRLKPVNFTNFPSGGGFVYYGILKRVGAGNWGIQGIFDNPFTPNRVFGDGTIRRNNLSGFSNFGVGAGTDVPLPVQLSDFSARRLGEDVELEWKTLSEQGFSHFDIQRSTDGIVFETIATISGKSDNGADYRYMDLAPFKGMDRLFYRLSLFDLSLHQSKSPIRVVKDKTPVITLGIYPNPVENTLWFSAPKTGNLKMYDAMGRLVLEKANTQVQLLDVSQLSQGMYTLILDTGDTIEKTRIVKH